MTTAAVVDSPENEQAQASWFLDTLVVEHRCTPEMDTVVLEMTLPAGSGPPLHVHDDLGDTCVYRLVPCLRPIGPPMSAQDSEAVLAGVG